MLLTLSLFHSLLRWAWKAISLLISLLYHASFQADHITHSHSGGQSWKFKLCSLTIIMDLYWDEPLNKRTPQHFALMGSEARAVLRPESPDLFFYPMFTNFQWLIHYEYDSTECTADVSFNPTCAVISQVATLEFSADLSYSYKSTLHVHFSWCECVCAAVVRVL